MGHLDRWESRLDVWWGIWQVSVALLVIGTLFALWAYITVPSPGTAIAILGVAAALMSIRPTPMLSLEKAGWILILTLLLIAEFRSIHKSDLNNASQRQDQINRLVNLTASSEEISAKIDKFEPKSIPIIAPASMPAIGRTRPALVKSSKVSGVMPSVNPTRSAEDQHLIDQLNDMVAANKPWGLSKDELTSLSRAMSAFATPENRADLITATMNDSDSQKFANQLVAAFRAADWNLPGTGMSIALFSGPVESVHVVVASREANPPGLGPFIQILRSAGINPIGEIDPKENPGQFRIIVGGRPN